MFEQLAPAIEELEVAIEELEVGIDGDALVAACRLLDRLTAKVALAAADFDASKRWELDGATSAAAWLQHRAGMTAPAAKWTVRTGNLVKHLPVTSEAWLSGALSTDQVRGVEANVDQRTVSLFAEHEAEVVPFLVPLSARQTATAMQHWRHRAEALLDDAEPRMPHRSLKLSQTYGGNFFLSGWLDPLSGEVVNTALRLAMTRDAEGERRSYATRQADALVDIARFYVDHQDENLGTRHRPHVNVVIDYDDLMARRGGESIDGTLLDGPAIATLLCDANIHRVVTKGRSAILDYGRSTRVVSRDLWNALVLRDRHCRVAGCDRPSRFCEAHHVVPVSEGGPTELGNLVLKCSRHHHMEHTPGHSEKLLPDGTLVVTDPQGRTRTTRPPGRAGPRRYDRSEGTDLRGMVACAG